MAGPLQDIRVLEVGLLIQGPQAAALLADMGADVVKIELPGGATTAGTSMSRPTIRAAPSTPPATAASAA